MTDRKHKTPPPEGAAAPGTEAAEARIAELEQQVADLTASNEVYLNDARRERAEFSNYIKRVERDQAQRAQDAVGRISLKYLDVLDDLERALKTLPDHEEGHTWAKGIQLIHKKLQGILDAEGIQEIQAEGTPFDPSRHEALSLEASPSHESGQVIEVIQKGYLIGERVLRPARVRVAQ